MQKTTPQQNKNKCEKKKHNKTKQRNPKKFIKKINLGKKKMEKKAYNAIVPHSLILLLHTHTSVGFLPTPYNIDAFSTFTCTSPLSPHLRLRLPHSSPNPKTTL
jgi:hypothetical protein